MVARGKNWLHISSEPPPATPISTTLIAFTERCKLTVVVSQVVPAERRLVFAPQYTKSIKDCLARSPMGKKFFALHVLLPASNPIPRARRRKRQPNRWRWQKSPHHHEPIDIFSSRHGRGHR
jgi:hypothetical protein